MCDMDRIELFAFCHGKLQSRGRLNTWWKSTDSIFAKADQVVAIGHFRRLRTWLSVLHAQRETLEAFWEAFGRKLHVLEIDLAEYDVMRCRDSRCVSCSKPSISMLGGAPPCCRHQAERG
jgi:hypothetical protein